MAVRISAIFILLCLLLIAAYPSLAQDATTSPTTRRDTGKENVQERMTAIKERIATREAAMKARLETFKDKRKAQIAERVNTNLNKINQNQTSQMLRHLNTMTSILDRLEARVNQNKPDIKDLTVARTAIAEAKAAIASASAAVSAQAEKDYTIVVTSETKVRQDAQTQRDQLHTDLKAVRQSVIDAKQKSANAIRAAKSNAGGKTSDGQ